MFCSANYDSLFPYTERCVDDCYDSDNIETVYSDKYREKYLGNGNTQGYAKRPGVDWHCFDLSRILIRQVVKPPYPPLLGTHT